MEDNLTQSATFCFIVGKGISIFLVRINVFDLLCTGRLDLRYSRAVDVSSAVCFSRDYLVTERREGTLSNHGTG